MSRILSAVLLTILTAPALAQSECESLLGDAARSYEAGRLDDAVALAEDCLSEEASKAEKILAYGLLARTYLELDRLDAADAALAELLRLDPDFEPDRINDPSVFIHRLEEAKKARAEFRISSVSKTLESLREAPATVVVLTAEEIRRRGYHDLEALVHDLSGFDVTRTNGATYSNLYQRGYRSDLTTRTALLVDGVVENDIWSQAAYLSRQYPLSNVERVEVIYGPASTMYGANAFAGVINIVTKDPGEVLAPGKRFAVEAQVAGGTWNTRYLDATAMGRSKNEAVSWSLTARKYQSDEMDLSGYDDWDWDPAFYESAELAGTYREQLSFDAATGNQTVDEYINEICTEDKVLDRGCVAGVRGSGYFDVTERGIALTDDGRRRAIELDQALLGQEFDGLTAGYEDLTDAWLLHGKLWSPNLILGFQTWKKKEGWPSRRTDQVSFGKRTWIPVQTWSYLRYSLPIGENLFLTLFTRYREHELDGQTRTIEVEKNYALGTLGIADLATETEGSLRKRYWYLRNSQFVNELKLVYSSPGARFHLVAGLEHRRGWVQGNYVFSREPKPSETGPEERFVGSNRFKVNDTGLYAQASYKPSEKLKLVAGGRFDNNKVRDTGGFGTVFNPRLAVIYRPGDFTFKAIYSTAFQDASNFQKYQSTSNGSAVPNPTLEPEEVENFEMSAGWQPTDQLSIDVVGYEARYRGRVALLLGGADCSEIPEIENCHENSAQFRNFGLLEIRGLQVDARLKYDRLSIFEDFVVFGNYTYTNPIDEVFMDVFGEEQFNQRVTDIASHQFNLGVNASWREKLNANLRVNYVGARKTGEGTDLPSNTLAGGQVDSYVVAHASFIWNEPLPHTSLQLIVNNLFDAEYFHPGIRGADGTLRPQRFPQQERSVYLRLLASF